MNLPKYGTLAAQDAIEMAAVLSKAAWLYKGGSYSNLMMAIPDAVVEWEAMYRKEAEQLLQEVDTHYIAHLKAELTLAFQFPLNFIK